MAALLIAASTTALYSDRSSDGVAALIELAPAPRERSLSPQQARALHAPAPSEAAAASIETQMLSRLLTCLDRRIANRPRDCPREPPPSEWEEPRIAVGGDFAPPPGVDLEVIYTRAELQTLVMPSCTGVCIRVGVRPPPPSRSAEEICRDANMGGPCTPPPIRETDAAQAP